MEGTIYRTKQEVLRRGQEAVGIPLRDIDRHGRLSTGKGAVGHVIEDDWFGYRPNSESEPDFPEAGVELKATPYVRTKKGIRAKERLVCNIINYMTEYNKTFYTSSFWHKCQTMLILSYEHRPNVPKGDFTIDRAILYSFPEKDLAIIERDWQTIMDKVRAGQAHQITEGDTLYLAACTKGASSSTVRPQPFSTIPAKQRAYSLKSSYMTQILNTFVFGGQEDEHIVKDWRALTRQSFEAYILEQVSPYFGWTQRKLKERFQVQSDAKSINELLFARMLGVRGRLAATEEFRNASIVPKTIRVKHNGKIKESMSFPAFRFRELVEEEWETSTLRNLLEPTKFLFIIFEEDAYGEYRFSRIKFWNIPADDLEEVRRVWETTVLTLRRGVRLWPEGGRIRNDLPKGRDSCVAHVRPHAKDSSDTDILPDGREMPKQCFWLKNSYIARQILADDDPSFL